MKTKMTKISLLTKYIDLSGKFKIAAYVRFRAPIIDTKQAKVWSDNTGNQPL